jgi:hypothetical protein
MPGDAGGTLMKTVIEVMSRQPEKPRSIPLSMPDGAFGASLVVVLFEEKQRLNLRQTPYQ